MGLEDFVKEEGVGIVLIDMQPAFVNQLSNPKKLIRRQMDFMDTYHIPIIGLELRPRVNDVTIKPLKEKIQRSGGRIFLKEENDGFTSEAFKDALVRRKLSKLILMGCNTSYCVLSTAKSAVKFGYEIAVSLDFVSEPRFYKKDFPSKIVESLDWYKQNSKVFLDETPKKRCFDSFFR